jgi:hypothetical protein
MIKLSIGFVLGFLVATVGLTGIVNLVDKQGEEVKEIVKQ